MRRKEKEITDHNEIDQIFEEAHVCRLGIFDGKKTYIVPMNYGYKEKVLYFHSALEGRKIDILKNNPDICFEIDIPGKNISSIEACKWSMTFKSIIGEGSVLFLNDEKDKTDALNIIMKHYSHESKWNFNKKMMEKTLVFTVIIDNMSVKKSG